MAVLGFHPSLWFFRHVQENTRRLREFLLPVSFRELYCRARPWQSPLAAKKLFDLARQNVGLGVLVEIGSAWGGTACLLSHATHSVNGEKLYCIDPWPTISRDSGGHWDFLWRNNDRYQVQPGSLYKQFQQNLQENGVPELVESLRATSVEAARSWNQPIKFLFIDASHEFDDVIADITVWEPHLVPNGLILFDDYLEEKNSDVHRAVQERIVRSQRFTQLQREDSLVWATKLR